MLCWWGDEYLVSLTELVKERQTLTVQMVQDPFSCANIWALAEDNVTCLCRWIFSMLMIPRAMPAGTRVPDRFNHDGLVTEKRPDRERLLVLNRNLLDLKDEDEIFSDIYSRILKRHVGKLHFNTVIFIEGNLKAFSDREMI